MRLTTDFVSGIFFSAFGTAGIYLSQQYSLGTPTRMGPGLFPMIVASLITLFGFFMMIQAVRKLQKDTEFFDIEFRPVVFLGAAIVAFGLLIERSGLVAALASLIFIGRLAGREGSVLEVFVMALVLIVISYLLFNVGLKLRIELW